MSTTVIFANPISGRGRGRAIAEKIAQRITQSKPLLIFDAPDSIDERNLPDSIDAVVSIGGDGTLRCVVQLFLARSVIPPLLVVPLGTANLMARHLNLKYRKATADEYAVRLLQQRRTVELDAAVANDRVFLLMAGVGLDARVVHELSRIRRGPIRMASYALPAALALRTFENPLLRISVDGQKIVDGEPGFAFVGNVREYGTGFPILAQAVSDDGWLDVCWLPCRSVLELPRLLMLIATGDHMRADGVIYLRAKQVQIDSAHQVPVQIDGDAAGHTPLRISMLARRIPFITDSV